MTDKRTSRKISKRKLEKLYLERKLSMMKIAIELNTTFKHVRYWILKHKIKPRTTSEACKGVKKSETTKQRMKIAANKRKEQISNQMRGENNPNWTGKPKDFLNSIRCSYKGVEWRNNIYKRDDYTCQICFDNTGGNLNADHIKPLSVIVREFNITTREESLNCNELWDLNNGRTLCETCHKKTDTWGFKALNKFKKKHN